MAGRPVVIPLSGKYTSNPTMGFAVYVSPLIYIAVSFMLNQLTPHGTSHIIRLNSFPAFSSSREILLSTLMPQTGLPSY